MTRDDQPAATEPSFLSGGGALGRMVRAHDWSRSPLGAPEGWSRELQTLVGVMLGSNQPMFVAWGPERAMLYNDGYSRLLGGKHPDALGRPFVEVWHDILEDIQPIVDRAFAGESTHMDDLMLVMTRNGFPEETHFAFSYTPVRDQTGVVVGMFCACTETTEKVRAERQLAGEGERLRDMFRQAPGFMAVLRGPEHVFEFTNASYQAMVDDRSIVGRPLAEALPELAGQGFKELLDHVVATGEPYVGRGVPVDLRFGPDATVERRTIDFVYAPIRDAEHRVSGVFVEGQDVTDAKAAEEAIRESERRLRLVQSAGGIGSFDWDLVTGGVHRSPEYLQLQGLPPDTPLDGTHSGDWLERVHPDDRVQVEAWFQADLARPGPFEHEYRIVKPHGGETIWLLNRGRVDGDAAGRPVRLLSAQSDITKRKEAEAALRDSEERLRLAQDAAAFGSFDWNLKTHQGQLSDTYVAIMGFRHAREVTTESLIARAHPEDRARLGAQLRSIDDGVAVDVSDTRIVLPDGRVRWIQSYARTTLDEAGVAVRRIGVIQDATERRLAEEALRDLNATLEERVAERTAERDRIWRLSTDMFARADYTGRLLAVSPAWTDVLGWSEAQLLTRPYADIIDPADVESVTAALTTMRDTGQPTRFENRILTADGVWKPIGWTVSPEADGERFIAVGRDLTEEKARERDLELAQEQLRQSQKMEAVGQLTGGIAHDFNNLLQGITGSLDLVKARLAQGRTGDLDRLINGAMTSASRAAALTHRLLAFSRRQPLDPKPVRANQLVASMEDLLRRTMGERIDLELVLAGGLWTTLCDANQLENALLNLAINARDAMPDGGKLTVETCNAHLDNAYAAQQRDVLPGQYVCICVSDTGTGMPADVIERAFDPFFTTKPTGQGTGLGLSMIYGFARQSEGYAKIYSEVGQGTTVKLYLPRHRGSAEPEDPVVDAPAPSAPHAGETVLVVEDEAVVRGLILEVLNDLGYRALEASDGPTGLHILRSGERIDLLVTDIGLPGLNGRQVADAGRVLRPDLKVLFMTGYAENAALAGGFLEPGMAMITKPFALDQLLTRVRNIVEG